MFRNSVVVTIMYGRTLKNRLGDLMHKAGLFRIMHYVPVLDADGNEIGMVATIKAKRKLTLKVVQKLFNSEGMALEPISVR